jgi:hypothetical protein
VSKKWKYLLLGIGVFIIAVIVIAVVGLAVYYPTTVSLTCGLNGQTVSCKGNSISLQGVGLCTSNCIYPSPYLSATILVSGSVPLSALHLFINGTDEGITTTANTMTNYALVFKAQPNNPAMPIVDGKTYTITLVATFQDKSTSTASATVVASSGTGISTTNT